MAKTKSKLQNCTTFNIYDFFNSPDTAEYCQSIGHKFNAVESAVMINNSRTRTLKEKMDAFRTIIAEYPDMEVPKGFNHGYSESFHKELEKVIDYKEKLFEKFFSTEYGAVYTVSINFSGRNPTGKFDDVIFSTFETALAAALKCLDENTNDSSNRGLQYEFLDFWICKKYFDSEDFMRVYANRTGEILEIDNYYEMSGEDEEEEENDEVNETENYGDYLESFFIDVPVPFKTGDLVEIPNSNRYNRMGDVFVLKYIIRDHPYHKNFILIQDTADMTAYLYYEAKGNLNYECTHFYPDLRYCRRELEGHQRILKYVSLFQMDKIDLCMLLSIQKCLMLDEIIKDIKGYIRNFDFSWTNDKLFE
jgi:hypothetical protein